MNQYKQFGSKAGQFLDKLKKVAPKGEKNRILLFLFVYYLALFSPAWQDSKFWSDDWAIYWDTRSSGTEVMNATVSNGRPILGWLLKGAYSSSFLLNHLVVLQLISIAGIYFLAIAIYIKMRKSRFSLAISLILVLGVGLLPGFQEYVYFISCFIYSWTCLFGFLSYIFFTSDKLSMKCLGIFLLTLALLIYPVGAMFFFLAFYIDYLESLNVSMPFFRFLRKVQVNFYGFLLSILLTLLCALSTSRILGIDSAARVQFIDTFALAQSKLEWILTRLVVSEFRIFSTVSPTPTQAILEFCLIFIPFSIALLAPWRKLDSRKFGEYILIILLPLLGAFPNLVISENQFEYRTLTATYSMAFLMWLVSARRIIELARSLKLHGFGIPLLATKPILLLASLLIAFQFHQTQIDSNRLWISPSLARDAITDSTLENATVLPPAKVCLVIPAGVYSQNPRMGIYSLKSDLASGWVPDPYIRTKLEMRSINFLGTVEVVKKTDECHIDDLVFDYSKLAD